jgi:hypothetical protein
MEVTMGKRLNLFLISGNGWSGTVDWTDEEERERLAEVTKAGYWDSVERMSIPARSIVSASITDDEEEVFG